MSVVDGQPYERVRTVNKVIVAHMVKIGEFVKRPFQHETRWFLSLTAYQKQNTLAAYAGLFLFVLAAVLSLPLVNQQSSFYVYDYDAEEVIYLEGVEIPAMGMSIMLACMIVTFWKSREVTYQDLARRSSNDELVSATDKVTIYDSELSRHLTEDGRIDAHRVGGVELLRLVSLLLPLVLSVARGLGEDGGTMPVAMQTESVIAYLLLPIIYYERMSYIKRMLIAMLGLATFIEFVDRW